MTHDEIVTAIAQRGNDVLASYKGEDTALTDYDRLCAIALLLGGILTNDTLPSRVRERLNVITSELGGYAVEHYQIKHAIEREPGS